MPPSRANCRSPFPSEVCVQPSRHPPVSSGIEDLVYNAPHAFKQPVMPDCVSCNCCDPHPRPPHVHRIPIILIAIAATASRTSTTGRRANTPAWPPTLQDSRVPRTPGTATRRSSPTPRDCSWATGGTMPGMSPRPFRVRFATRAVVVHSSSPALLNGTARC